MADETKDGDGGGKGEGDGRADLQARIDAQVEAKLAKQEARAVIKELMADNFKARDEVRDLRAKLPSDGSMVLSGDDAQAWAKYRDLGKPEDLKKAVTEREQFRAENARHARDAQIREVADLHYKGKDRVLAKLLEGVDFTIDEVTDKDGKKARAAMVKAVKEGDKPVLLTEFIETNHSDFLPALTGKPPEATTRPANGPPARKIFDNGKPPADPAQTIHEETRRLGNYSRF